MKRVLLLALATALITPTVAAKQRPEAKQGKSVADCVLRPKCKDLSTCEEARHYLNDCGQQNLDRDRDGIPCESLCGDAKRKRK